MTWASLLYAMRAGLVVIFQIPLSRAAPRGHLAMGGRWPGRFPPGLRRLALAQGGLMVAIGWTVAAHGGWVPGPVPPPWGLWLVVALTALTTVLNLITPSRRERRLRGQVTGVMLVAAIIVATGQGRL